MNQHERFLNSKEGDLITLCVQSYGKAVERITFEVVRTVKKRNSEKISYHVLRDQRGKKTRTARWMANKYSAQIRWGYYPNFTGRLDLSV